MNALEESIRELSLNQLRKFYKGALEEWSETDTAVKGKASEVLTEAEMSDDYSFVGVEDIVDQLVKKIKDLKKEKE
jgi:hypothetical protein